MNKLAKSGNNRVMEKSKFGRFLDTSAIAIIFAVICLILLRKYFNIVHSIVLSIALSFVFVKIILHFQIRKYNKLNIKKQELKLVELTNIELRKLSRKEQLFYFVKVFRQDFIKVSNGFIVLKNAIIKPYLHLNKITEEQIFECYAYSRQTNNSCEEITLICNDFTSQAKTLAKSLNNKITFLPPALTYSVLKKYNALPTLPEQAKKVKLTPIILIKSSFVRKQSKNFIISGLLLYFTSLFVPYTAYYLTTASILLIFGLTCLIFGKKDNTINFESIFLK